MIARLNGGDGQRRWAGDTSAAEPVSTALLQSIAACCDARGDDDRNRAALIADSVHLTRAQQHEMTEHFNTEARAWRAATGQERSA